MESNSSGLREDDGPWEFNLALVCAICALREISSLWGSGPSARFEFDTFLGYFPAFQDPPHWRDPRGGLSRKEVTPARGVR